MTSQTQEQKREYNLGGCLELTKEERQLKEAMKLILRDGAKGKYFELAKERYLTLKTDERIDSLVHEMEGIEEKEYYNDIVKINNIING